MLDLRIFREQPERIKAGVAKRGGDVEDVERVRGLDEQVRALKTEAEAKKAELNAATKQMGAVNENPERGRPGRKTGQPRAH